MNLTELKVFLNEWGVRPKKGLSQNFLIDKNIVAKIIKEADVRQDDYIVEIGPGPGALTHALVAARAQVVAVELDAVLAEALKRFPITVYQEDILTFSFEKLTRKGKVVSNLPYHLTAPILARLVPQRERFSTITVMVQEEVARRMTASANTEEYGLLTLLLNFYSTPHYAFRVSRHCFYPSPKVDSAVVTLVLKEPPHVNVDQFFALTRTAFQQRRKMLKNTLAPKYGVERVIEAMEKTGINLKTRPEELSLEAFLGLFSHLQ